MKKDLILEEKNRSPNEFKNFLEEALREGARKLLSYAIENEVSEYIESLKTLRMKQIKGL